MKLHVTGLETIEITDPKGVGNQARPPTIPTPFGPNITPLNLIVRPTVPSDLSEKPTPWEKKWQTGLTGDPPDSLPSNTSGAKWTRNMQLAAAGDELGGEGESGKHTYAQ